jgi:hypothetical protein
MRTSRSLAALAIALAMGASLPGSALMRAEAAGRR